MVELVLTKTRVQAGVWEGVLTANTSENYQPELAVLHLEQELPGVSIVDAEGDDRAWLIRFPIPAELLADGIQTFLFCDKRSGDRLTSFSVLTGKPLEDDIRTEVDLLRAELDMLKRAFRRHCLETMG